MDKISETTSLRRTATEKDEGELKRKYSFANETLGSAEDVVSQYTKIQRTESNQREDLKQFFGDCMHGLRTEEERTEKKRKQPESALKTLAEESTTASGANFIKEKLELSLDELYDGCERYMRPLFARAPRWPGMTEESHRLSGISKAVDRNGNSSAFVERAYGVMEVDRKEFCRGGISSDVFVVHVPAGARDGCRIFVEEKFVHQKRGIKRMYQSRLDLGGNPLPFGASIGKSDTLGCSNEGVTSPRRSRSLGKHGKEVGDETQKAVEEGFVGGGDYNATITAMKGNVYIFEVIEKHHAFYVRKNHDLYRTVRISLEQALTGFDLGLDHLGNRSLSLHFRDVIQPHEVRVIKGEGMPKYAVIYGEGNSNKNNATEGENAEANDETKQVLHRGDLYLTFDIKFPKSLSNSQKKAIREVLRS